MAHTAMAMAHTAYGGQHFLNPLMTHHWQKQLCCHHRPSPGSSWRQPEDYTVLASYRVGSEYLKFC